MCDDIGKIEEIGNGFEWKIENFFSLFQEPGQEYTSPDFSYNDEDWYFEIFLNSDSANNTDGYINVSLENNGECLPIIIDISLALKTINGEKCLERHSVADINKSSKRHTVFRFMSRSELVKRKDELVPSDVLTVLFTLTNLEPFKNDITTVFCQYCKKIFSAQEISFHEKKCRIKCPDCSNFILYKSWNDHECQMSVTEDAGSLCEDLKKVLVDGINHDLILKVGDKELRAHQDILKARSKVFKSMLSIDMTEKNNRVIDVPDCDPQAMEVFLSYVYCGKVETLDQNNMIDLYYIADKYDMQNLKDKCSDFIKTSSLL